MANDLNRCEFIGRLGADPEITYTASGTAVAKLRIACGRQWKDRDGNRQEATEWVRVTAFGKLAEIIGEYCTKGQQIYLAGRFQTSEYEKNGEKRYSTEIIADQMQMLGGKSQSGNDRSQGGNANDGQKKPVGGDDFDDDLIPFIRWE